MPIRSGRRGMLSIPPIVWAGLIVLSLFFLWGISRQWSCRAPRPPKPSAVRTYAVIRTTTGASFEVSSGLRDRKTATVIMDGIAAPTQGEPLFEESRANLERLAGSEIRVESPRHRLLRSTPTDDVGQDSLPQQDDATEATVATPGNADHPPMIWTSPQAKAWVLECKRIQPFEHDEAFARDLAVYFTRTRVPRSQWLDRTDVIYEWYWCHLEHRDCKKCLAAWFVLCTGWNRNNEYLTAPIPDGDGAQLLEARGPITGVCFGQSGSCLQLEQVKAGLARCVGDVPGEWSEAERDAKKSKRGIWQ